MIKLIATDLDGTLLNNNSEISNYNKKVLKKLMNNGIEIIFSTGRPFEGMKRYKDIIENDNHSIVFNGAIIADSNGDFIYNKPINKDTAMYIIDIYNKYKHKDIYLHVYSGNQYIVSEEDIYFKRYIEKENITDTVIGLDNAKDFYFSKMLFIGERYILETIQDEVKNNIKADISFSHTNFLEILAYGINKGSALKWLCDIKGIKREEIVAFGDNYNDIEMLKYAGTGVAVENAEGDVKKNADYICLRNDENGVGKFLEKFLDL
ncbi:Cof-type HAD-IIB family hydrolase [uncultured Brachyspira sp.]|uniref:Cof-type HAD-IIB family hydrolase n=1 Tax=uncultured Brachyspira sp. TaxID=221953 RepID=UPI00262AC34C|nr:Cof-type HAD-IIB family hydrolase [uncultured Brachyspira sp.]